jgi:sec-independent protein translocase protein TatA
MTPLFALLGLPGYLELLLLAGILLLLFGHRVPEVMKQLGLGISSFKRGLHAGEDAPESRSAT